jgi:two-component system, cell cycle response regulator CpdR
LGHDKLSAFLSPSVPATPLRILYVEDNAIVREVTCELLAQDQRRVIAVATAEEALNAFKETPFDVLITDVSLPVMSGLDLARSILTINPGARIIIASGYVLTSGVESLGRNVRTIVKPFEAREINSLITDLCASRGC